MLVIRCLLSNKWLIFSFYTIIPLSCIMWLLAVKFGCRAFSFVTMNCVRDSHQLNQTILVSEHFGDTLKTSYPIVQRLFAMRRYGRGILYAALPLHMQRGCFRIRTHDQQVTKAQLYRCTRARPHFGDTLNLKFVTMNCVRDYWTYDSKQEIGYVGLKN